MEKITSIALGGSGLAASAVEFNVLRPEFDYSSLVTALTQISIAIVTILSLFKPAKSLINPKN